MYRLSNRYLKIALFISAIFFSFAYAQTSSVQKDPAGILLSPIKVSPNTYFVQGLPEMGTSENENFISNAGFVITPKGVVVIDALGSPVLAQKLIKEISKLTSQKIIAVIVTHYHADHVYGLQEFKKIGAKIYAQNAMRHCRPVKMNARSAATRPQHHHQPGHFFASPALPAPTNGNSSPASC